MREKEDQKNSKYGPFSHSTLSKKRKVHFQRANMSNKVRGDVRDEQGERFYQDVKLMEERYQEKWDVEIKPD